MFNSRLENEFTNTSIKDQEGNWYKEFLNFPEFSDKNITVNESTNITIVCPIQGAYRTINVIKWKHTIGNNNTVVRNFTTQAVKLVDAKFEDSGKYHYTIEYQTCGDQAGRLMQKEGFVSVNFNGKQ